MIDSNEREALAAKHEQNRKQRVERVKRWAKYIKSTPAEEWGPQHVKLVNSQIEAAQNADLPAEHYRRVEEAGEQFRREHLDDE